LCQQQLLSELAQAKLVVQVQDLKQVAKYVHRNQQVFELKMKRIERDAIWFDSMTGLGFINFGFDMSCRTVNKNPISCYGLIKSLSIIR
jgi:hypothetical protein